MCWLGGCGCWVGDCGGPLSCGAVCRCVLGTAAVIFLLASAFRAMFWAMPFSFLSLEAFSAGNALLFSGIRRIRYRRGPPTVRNMRAVQKTGSWGTRRIFRGIRCKKQAFPVQNGYSVPEAPFSGTGHVCRKHSSDARVQFIQRYSVQGRSSFLQSGCSGGFNRSCFLVLGARQWAASYPGRDSMVDFCPGRILQGDLCPGEWYYRRKCGC